MNSQKIAALVTARGNNTFKQKHLAEVLDHPLVWYPISAAKKCSLFERLYISSDDNQILDIGKNEGYRLIKRPENISRPTSRHVDAIFHALEIMRENDNYVPDILVVILGNTVYFKEQWLTESIRRLVDDPSLSSVVPVYRQNDHHPYRAKHIDKNGLLQSYFDFPDGISTNRQDLPENYFLCHNFWALRISNSVFGGNKGQAPWNFMGDKISPLVLDAGLDVHSKEDIGICEEWLTRNIIKQ